MGITGNFHRDDRVSFQGLGAPSSSGLVIKYYAPSGSLRWRNAQWRQTYDDLRRLDQDWQNLLRALASFDLSELPFLGTADVKMIDDGVEAFSSSPMPIVGELALLLQVIGAGRPLDASCVDTLVFAQERLIGVAGYFYAVSGFLGVAAGIASIGTLGADLGVSAVGLLGASATSAFTATVALGLGGCAGDISKGKMPSKSNVKLITDGATTLAGNEPIDESDRNAARAAFSSTVEQRVADTKREDAITLAKRKSLAKKNACRARGGVFDPTAPDGCRVPSRRQIDKTGEKINAAGGDVPPPKDSKSSSAIVPVGLAALGVVGVWLAWPKKRSNPTPKRRRRNRRR